MATLFKKGSEGEEVKQIQTRLTELKYLNDVIDGIFGKKTEKALKEFQTASGLDDDGICGPLTWAALFNTEIPETTTKIDYGKSSTEPAHGTAQIVDWWDTDFQKKFPKGTILTITDVDTGIAWREKRCAGTNHADLQPCTAADTAAFKAACGKWSWARRAVFATINGVNYAGSINCKPHGGSSISGNKFDGHHCLHLLHSRTHGTNREDENHQKMVQKAGKAKLP